MSIEVNINKRFEDFNLNVNFSSDSNSIGILGASGCGKSMTLKSIAGIITPDSGRIIINNKVLFDSERGINLRPQHRRVGYLFQNYALFPNMTVAKNIECGISTEDRKSGKGKIELDKLIHMLRLEGLKDRYPSQLSGGQQQRVATARMLAAKPEVLLLDEPFSALDGYLRESLQAEFIDMISMADKDFVLVTHSRDEAYRMCSEIMLIDNGSVIESGRTKEVFNNPKKVESARLTGCKNILKAVKTGPNRIFLTDWDVEMIFRDNIPDGVCAVGIRAHDFSPLGGELFINVGKPKIIEGPFEWTFIYSSEKAGSIEKLWWKIPKQNLKGSIPTIVNKLYTSMDSVMIFT